MRAVCCVARAAVCKYEGFDSPGVVGAYVQRVECGGADVPGGVQVVQLAVLVDEPGAVGVVAAEALVHVAVVDDGLIRAIPSLLNLVDVTRRDAIQDERSPARRHPKVHV